MNVANSIVGAAGAVFGLVSAVVAILQYKKAGRLERLEAAQSDREKRRTLHFVKLAQQAVDKARDSDDRAVVLREVRELRNLIDDRARELGLRDGQIEEAKKGFTSDPGVRR